MKLSEKIAELANVINEYGDLEIIYLSGEADNYNHCGAGELVYVESRDGKIPKYFDVYLAIQEGCKGVIPVYCIN